MWNIALEHLCGIAMNLWTIWYSIIVLSKTGGCFEAGNKRLGYSWALPVMFPFWKIDVLDWQFAGYVCIVLYNLYNVYVKKFKGTQLRTFVCLNESPNILTFATASTRTLDMTVSLWPFFLTVYSKIFTWKTIRSTKYWPWIPQQQYGSMFQ